MIKDCPHEFKELVRDLSTVYGVMKRIEEDYNSQGSAIKALIAEFDRVWNTRVVRTRDILLIADELKG